VRLRGCRQIAGGLGQRQALLGQPVAGLVLVLVGGEDGGGVQ
jgi:hypothetical protein